MTWADPKTKLNTHDLYAPLGFPSQIINEGDPWVNGACTSWRCCCWASVTAITDNHWSTDANIHCQQHPNAHESQPTSSVCPSWLPASPSQSVFWVLSVPLTLTMLGIREEDPNQISHSLIRSLAQQIESNNGYILFTEMKERIRVNEDLTPLTKS